MPTVEHSYPLTIPSAPAPTFSYLRIENVVGEAESVFTRAAQVQRHQGSQWMLTLDFPKVRDAVVAGTWEAFLMKLQGRYGYFSFGDPDRTSPQGSISGSPLVAGGSQTGNSIAVDALPETTAGLLLPGDMISFANYQYMHKVVEQVDSDSSGAATIIFEPQLRSSPANNAALQYNNVTGIFRLKESAVGWESDTFKNRTFRLDAKEAL